MTKGIINKKPSCFMSTGRPFDIVLDLFYQQIILRDIGHNHSGEFIK